MNTDCLRINTDTDLTLNGDVRTAVGTDEGTGAN